MILRILVTLFIALYEIKNIILYAKKFRFKNNIYFNDIISNVLIVSKCVNIKVIENPFPEKMHRHLIKFDHLKKNW